MGLCVRGSSRSCVESGQGTEDCVLRKGTEVCIRRKGQSEIRTISDDAFHPRNLKLPGSSNFSLDGYLS